MSYEILYKRFITVEENEVLTPYIICGSSNCFEYSGKRERSLQNMLEWKYYTNKYDTEDLVAFLGNVWEDMSKTDYWHKLPKTKKGFVNGFFKNIINKEKLIDNGVDMEIRLNNLNTNKKPRLNAFDVATLKKDEPFIRLTLDNVTQIYNKSILFFNNYKQLIGKGRIKKTNNNDIGFFKTGVRRYYQPLNGHNQYYYKVI